ncbi:MAG: hypothetical protein ABEJ88_08040 [Halobacterium sp.]
MSTDESAPTPESPQSPDARTDSRWWYWVAAVPVYYVLASVVGVAAGVFAFAFALAGGGLVGDPVAVGAFGVGGGLAFVAVVLLLVGLGMLLSVVFPLAIYLDADAVRASGGDWRPDATLYGLLGLAGVVAQPLQVPLAVYYLYKRRQFQGRP